MWARRMSAEWSADFVHVALNLLRHALALMSRMIIVTTRANIHGGDEHEGARKRDGVFCTGDGDLSVFQGLAQGFECGARELGKFVQEEDAIVCQTYLPRLTGRA